MVQKPYKQPKPAQDGLAAFKKEVKACNIFKSRTTIMPLVKRAIDEFNFDPQLITPNVPATQSSVTAWLRGKSTPNAASRYELKAMLLQFLNKKSLGPPAKQFVRLRAQIETYDPADGQGFPKLLQSFNRLFPKANYTIAAEARVPLSSLEEWIAGGDSILFQRRRVIEVLLNKYLWRYK